MLAYIVLEICRWRGSEILVFPILSVLSDSDDEFLFSCTLPGDGGTGYALALARQRTLDRFSCTLALARQRTFACCFSCTLALARQSLVF